nr:PREDICTED: trafficking protein particle complex subunit 10 [Bemisia tabaci]
MNHPLNMPISNETQEFSLLDKKPLVTYAGDVDLFKSLETTLANSLSSEPAEWCRSYNRGSKSVKVTAEFTPFQNDCLPKEGDWRLLQQPVFHTFWTQCSDMEMYKASLREEIESWLKVLSHHNVLDWMIVLVETYDFRKHNKLLPRTTVLDKIKNDFGAKHADRCLSVINPLRSEMRSGGSWRRLVVNFRLLLLSAYDRLLWNFEEKVRSQRERRTEPDWNFCKYFLLQEELAFVLAMLGVYDEALVQYDELDALFTQFVLNYAVGEVPSWLNKFQGPLDRWHGVSLTQSVDLNLRSAIRNCSISLLDFRCYLYSRQAAMLLLSGKPWEVASRCISFCNNCINELDILEVSCPPGAVACWVWLCCIEVLNTCQKYTDSKVVSACSLYTARLWDCATKKLLELGELCGLLPDQEKSSANLHAVVMLSAGIADSDPSEKLKHALSSKDAFTKEYLELAELAMGTYKHIGRIRSARMIGLDLASFYISMKDLTKAVSFLSSALRTYEEDNWPLLALQCQLKLAKCYKEMDDLEKFARMCASIASSPCLDLTTRTHYFDQMTSLIYNTTDAPWRFPLSDCIQIISAEVVTLEENLAVEAILELDCRLPSQFIVKSIAVSVEQLKTQPDNRGKRNSLIPQENHARSCCEENAFLMKLPIQESFEYQQDGSLGSVSVVCKNQKHHLKRQDSQGGRNKRLVSVPKGDFSQSLILKDPELKPGRNRLVLKSKINCSGTFRLGQVCVEVNNRLELLSTTISPRLYFTAIWKSPSVNLEKSSEGSLLVGVEERVKLVVSTNSQILPENSHVQVICSGGLLIKADDDSKSDFQKEITLPVKSCKPHENLTIPVTLLSQMVQQKDASLTADHTICVILPSCDKPIEIPTSFHYPFIHSISLQSAALRKFINVLITSYTTFPIKFSNPQLKITNDISSTYQVSLTSLNPSSEQTLCNRTNGRKIITFVWELKVVASEPLSEALAPSLQTQFSIDYCVQNEENAESTKKPLNLNFEVSNYRTLFEVELKVEPKPLKANESSESRASEFCRAKTVCQLTVSVMRAASCTCSSLHYEVLADQAFWAVCGERRAGYLSLESSDKFSVTVDVMPLTSGFLPLPIVRLSKYVGDNAARDPRWRVEPFSRGEVYYRNKASQVHVLVPIS